MGGDGGTGPGSDGSNGPLPDGADAPLVCASWHAHHFAPCMIPAPTPGLDLLGAWTFSTDSGELTGPSSLPPPVGGPLAQSDGTTAYIISIESLTVETTGSLRVIGMKPLIIASWGDIDIAGTIDAGSTAAGQAGAGSNPSECNGATQGQTGVMSGGSGGGGGGGFGGTGGHGGTGDNPPGPLGGAGGNAIANPSVVIGGCSGAPSGEAGSDPTASDPTAIAAAGLGGGAVQITSRTSIVVTGKVLSGGGGGGGAPLNSADGGGGGGAGGFVGFDGPTISFSNATLAANGGGGGGSAPFGSSPTTNVGQPGEDGQPSGTAAIGGAASSCSEAGMSGGASNNANGASSGNPVEACGGAGGGGSVGYILTWGTVTEIGSTISPPAQAGP